MQVVQKPKAFTLKKMDFYHVQYLTVIAVFQGCQQILEIPSAF